MENLHSSTQEHEKKGKTPTKIAYLHAHGSKKFQVELFAGQHQVYGKLFRKRTAHRISVVQIVLAAVVVMAQISTMCLLRWYTSMEYQGLGIWTSTITVLSAGVSLLACKKTTYVRLHFAMALHILSIVGSLILVTCAFADSIPTQNRRLFRYLTQDNDYPNGRYYYNYYHNNNYNSYNSNLDDSNTTTSQPPAPYYNYNYYNSYDDQGPIGVVLTTLVLSSIMAFSGLVQLVLSIIMSIMSARAMCSGRSKMEGKIFAMEIKGREDGDVIAYKSSTGNQSLSELGQQNPPPYDKVSFEHNNTSSSFA